MSASQKLKALDGKVFDSQESVEELLTALPEIIAVIEAAEKAGSTAEADYGMDRVFDALAALEEKLS